MQILRLWSRGLGAGGCSEWTLVPGVTSPAVTEAPILSMSCTGFLGMAPTLWNPSSARHQTSLKAVLEVSGFVLYSESSRDQVTFLEPQCDSWRVRATLSCAAPIATHHTLPGSQKCLRKTAFLLESAILCLSPEFYGLFSPTPPEDMTGTQLVPCHCWDTGGPRRPALSAGTPCLS